MNQLKTGVLLAGLTALVMGIGYYFGRTGGMMLAFGLALVMNAGSYWFSDRIVLAMYRAQPVTPEQAPDLYAMVTRLCERANLPMPALYVVPDPTPNAFATGRDPKHSAVAVNDGLLRLLNSDEVEAVIAHELGHVKHRDTLITTISATMAGAIMMLARMAQYSLMFSGYGHRDRDRGENPIALLAMVILAPVAAMLLQLAVSRSREYEADRASAQLTGRPLSLAGALRKLETANDRQPMNASPATAHMFIVNPLRGQAFASLFSTHPPVAERIARLEEMAQATPTGQPAYTWR
jgi:heat shock protein HtpX